jgi:hypothetical protein
MLAIHAQRVRAVELPIPRAAAPRGQKLPARIEFTDSILGKIRDIDILLLSLSTAMLLGPLSGVASPPVLAQMNSAARF